MLDRVQLDRSLQIKEKINNILGNPKSSAHLSSKLNEKRHRKRGITAEIVDRAK